MWIMLAEREARARRSDLHGGVFSWFSLSVHRRSREAKRELSLPYLWHHVERDACVVCKR